jgi:hypothetical protein
MKLRAKVGDRVSGNFFLGHDYKLHINIVAEEGGIVWKITRSEMVESGYPSGPKRVWRGVGGSLVIPFLSTNEDDCKKLDNLLGSVGVVGEVRERFDERLNEVCGWAVKKWGVKGIEGERE